jgi:hypothetical protein
MAAVALALGSGCVGHGADVVRTGMTESEVVAVLGQPSRVLSGAEILRHSEGRDRGCQPTRLAIYRRAHDEVVHVAYSASQRVNCVWRRIEKDLIHD